MERKPVSILPCQPIDNDNYPTQKPPCVKTVVQLDGPAIDDLDVFLGNHPEYKLSTVSK